MKSYEEIFSYQNLYKAYLRIRLSKRHKTEVIEFELSLGKNLQDIFLQLKNRTYEITKYHCFMIYDPKEREIQALQFSDRIIQRAFCDQYMMPLLERHLIYDNGACMKGKGTDFSRKRLKTFLHDYFLTYHTNEGYALKCDISKYFASINHDVLKSILMKKIKDEAIKSFLWMIIDSYQQTLGIGLPMGNQTSQAFALLYLDCVDRYIKEVKRVKYYTRYMDDFILIHPCKEFLKSCLKEIKSILKDNLSLKLNPKTHIVKLRQGIDYLGARYYLLDRGRIVVKMTRKNKRNVLKKVDAKNLSFYKEYLKRYNQYRFLQKLTKSV